MKNIDSILKDLDKISNSNIVDIGSITGIFSSSNSFEYLWLLNNSEKQPVNYTVSVDSPEDAYKIISKFSGEKIETVRSKVLEYNSFITSKPLYLHFSKIIKNK